MPLDTNSIGRQTPKKLSLVSALALPGVLACLTPSLHTPLEDRLPKDRMKWMRE